MLRGKSTLAGLCVLAAVGVADAAPKMLKGPYLQDLAPSSITVMWQMDQLAPATLVVDGPGGERRLEIEPDRIVEARVEGLVPSSRYRYRVEAGGEVWRGEFATAPPDGKDVPYSFIVVGDSRGNINQHRRVVQRMSQEVPDFVLGTGDMVDEGYRQDQWQEFFDVENEMLRDNVYFPALGNHDRQGRGRTADSYRAYFSLPDNGDGERSGNICVLQFGQTVDRSHCFAGSGSASASASVLTTLGGLLTAVGATVATARNWFGGRLPRGNRSM